MSFSRTSAATKSQSKVNPKKSTNVTPKATSATTTVVAKPASSKSAAVQKKSIASSSVAASPPPINAFRIRPTQSFADDCGIRTGKTDTTGVADATYDDSFDNDDAEACWEDDMKSRHEFLDGLAGLLKSETDDVATSTSMKQQPIVKVQPIPVVKPVQDEIRGLDEESIEDESEFNYATSSPQTFAATSPLSHHQYPAVPSLFSICVSSLGHHYLSLPAHELSQTVLPSGTFFQAMDAVRSHGMLEDDHLPLMFRTLGAKKVGSDEWLKKDCRVEELEEKKVEEIVQQQEEMKVNSNPATPSSSISPTSSTPSSPTPPVPKSKSKLSSSPPPIISAAAAHNARFAPLRTTPGIKSASGHSMNTATLARAAKQAKSAATAASLQQQRPASGSKAKVKMQSESASNVASAPSSSASTPSIKSPYIFSRGESLDLHAQHKITSYGYRLICGFISFTRAMERGEEFIDDEEMGGMTQEQINKAEQGFTEEQKKRLAAAGMSEEIRALLGNSSPSSTNNNSRRSLPITSLARRLGIIHPVTIINLDVSFSSIDSTGLSLISRHCPLLLKVNISGCEKITNSGIRDLARFSRQIQVLQMDLLPCLDDSAIQDLIHGLKHLLSLDMGSCVRLSNISCQLLGSHYATTLKHLSLAGCSQLCDLDVEDIAKCTELRSLNLRACKKITDQSIQSLVESAVQVRKRKEKKGLSSRGGIAYLDFGGCVRLNDGSINMVCQAYKNALVELDLRGLTRLTNRAIDAIVVHCFRPSSNNGEAAKQTLQELNLTACSGITVERIQALRESWPALHIVV